MSNEPTDGDHPTHEESIPGPDDAEYPSTLRITSLPAAAAQAATQDRMERWEQGEAVPRVINFEDPSRLRELLAPRRMELLESVMEDPPESIRALADRLDRDVHDVHTDLHLLAEYRIIHFREAGRAKQPYVPYDTVRIEVEFSTSSSEGSETPASV